VRRFHGLEAPWPSAEDPRPDSFTRVWVKSKMIFIFPFLTLPVTILSYWASHSPHRPLSLSLMCALAFTITVTPAATPPSPCSPVSHGHLWWWCRRSGLRGSPWRRKKKPSSSPSEESMPLAKILGSAAAPIAEEQSLRPSVIPSSSSPSISHIQGETLIPPWIQFGLSF